LTFDLSLDELRKRRSAKWSMYDDDVLPSHFAEMDFALAPVIVAAIGHATERGDLGYAHAPAAGLGDAFARFALRRWDWPVDPQAVVAVPEVMVGVAELLRVLTAPDAAVVVNTPVYPPFFTVIAETGRRVVEVPMMREGEGWRLPLEGIDDAFADGAKALLLCNPHNPTGSVATKGELLKLAEIVAQNDAVVVSDEIHAPLTFPGATHVPFSSLPGPDGDRAIVLTSASKGWNIAGLKCAVAVARSTPMRDALAALPVDLPDRVGHLGVVASVSAFAEGEPWLDEIVAYLDGTRRWLPGLLAERLPGVDYEPGQATYLVWLDCRDLGLGDEPAAHFLEHGRVALTSGPEFGAAGRGFARLNIGTSRAIVEEAVNRMARAVAIST
jgi:cysteine-S-conjugate beta-lyase